MPASRGLRWTLLAVLVALTAQAQSPAPSPAARATDPLLAELRLLRQASDRQARVDLLVARALLQQGRVTRTQMQVSSVEGELASLTRERARLRAADAEYDRAIGYESDSSRRHTLDLGQKALQAQQKQYDAAAADVQERLLQVRQSLDAEGSRLDELAARLDALERELQRARPE